LKEGIKSAADLLGLAIPPRKGGRPRKTAG
jgi:hypothetical protein